MVPVWGGCGVAAALIALGTRGQFAPASVIAAAPAPLLASLPPPSALPLPPVAPHPHGGLNVTFWNLQWFPGHRPGAGVRAQTHHVALVLPIVQRLAPDVLGLEECGDSPAAERLTDGLPGFHVDVCTEFTREPNHEPSRQQIVLCSRLPLLAAGWQPFRPDANGLQPRRGFAFAAYRLPADEVLLVYGLHLKSNVLDEPGGDATNVAMREESVRQLLAHQHAETAACARWGRVRLTLVGGDMNTSLDDSRFQAETTLRSLLAPDGGFRWIWQGVPLPLRLSLPGGGPYPPACFDHIFYQGEGVRLLTAAADPTARNVSDHHPVSARFEW